MDGTAKGTSYSPEETTNSDAPMTTPGTGRKRESKLGHMTLDMVKKISARHPNFPARSRQGPNNFPHPMNGDGQGMRGLSPTSKQRMKDALLGTAASTDVDTGAD